MRAQFIRTKDEGYVQVAYIQRVFVTTANRVVIELGCDGQRKEQMCVSDHVSAADAQKALGKLMMRIAFGRTVRS